MADPSEHPPKESFLHRHATSIWLAYWVILTGLLHSPKLPAPPIPIRRSDLVAHFVTFAILTTLCVYARRTRHQFTRLDALLWTIALLAYSALSEILQPLTNRGCDLSDFIANASGILVVMLIVLKKRLYTSSSPD